MYINMAHIFSIRIIKKVWKYVNQFAEFNRFTNSPVANYHGELYSLPFNMYTFNKMWGVVTPQEAATKNRGTEQGSRHHTSRRTWKSRRSAWLAQIYMIKLVKGYTEKQWGRLCSELPAFIS